MIVTKPLELSNRMTLTRLLKEKKLLTLVEVGKRTGYYFGYLRLLCRKRKIDHHKILGRYYMTPEEVAKLLTPVKATLDSDIDGK